MFTTDSEIYQFIVDDLNRLEDNWVMITLKVKLGIMPNEDVIRSIGYRGEYIDNLGETKWLFKYWEEDRLLGKAFKALYKIMTKETDKHKWNRLVVTLIKDGDLDIKFEWDQSYQDELIKAQEAYDPRLDDSLTQEEKDKKYKEMVDKGELLDYSKINIKFRYHLTPTCHNNP